MQMNDSLSQVDAMPSLCCNCRQSGTERACSMQMNDSLSQVDAMQHAYTHTLAHTLCESNTLTVNLSYLPHSCTAHLSLSRSRLPHPPMVYTVPTRTVGNLNPCCFIDAIHTSIADDAQYASSWPWHVALGPALYDGSGAPLRSVALPVAECDADGNVSVLGDASGGSTTVPRTDVETKAMTATVTVVGMIV